MGMEIGLLGYVGWSEGMGPRSRAGFPNWRVVLFKKGNGLRPNLVDDPWSRERDGAGFLPGNGPNL